MRFKKYEIIFDEVYDALIVNNHVNDEFKVNIKNLSKGDLMELKKLLEEELISFVETNQFLICYLDDESKKIAKGVYTDEARKRLLDEKRQLKKEFMKDFLNVIE